MHIEERRIKMNIYGHLGISNHIKIRIEIKECSIIY